MHLSTNSISSTKPSWWSDGSSIESTNVVCSEAGCWWHLYRQMALLFKFFFGLNQHANIGSVSLSFCLGGRSSWAVLVSHSGLQLSYSVINVFYHRARHCLILSFNFQIHTETHTQNREFSRQNQSIIVTFPSSLLATSRGTNKVGRWDKQPLLGWLSSGFVG